MEIENACFYHIEYKGMEKIVFALQDGVQSRLRFIEHLSAGIEESFDPSLSRILQRLGNATEIWSDEFASQVLSILVKDGLQLDTLESLQLLKQVREQSLKLSDLPSIRFLVANLLEERKEIEEKRTKLWNAFAHHSTI